MPCGGGNQYHNWLEIEGTDPGGESNYKLICGIDPQLENWRTQILFVPIVSPYARKQQVPPHRQTVADILGLVERTGTADVLQQPRKEL